MTKQSLILEPIRPRIPESLEAYKLEKIKADEWLEISHNLVDGVSFSDVLRINIESSKLVKCSLLSLRLDKLEVHNTLIEKTEAAAFQALKSSYSKVIFSDSRMTGADFGGASFEDCVFQNVKLDEAGFKMASFKKVQFIGCVLSNADFYQAKLSNVSFVGCELEGTNFDSMACKAVDLRGENLSLIKGVLGLKGVRISNEQLYQVAPLLAHELGFKIS